VYCHRLTVLVLLAAFVLCVACGSGGSRFSRATAQSKCGDYPLPVASAAHAECLARVHTIAEKLYRSDQRLTLSASLEDGRWAVWVWEDKPDTLGGGVKIIIEPESGDIVETLLGQ